MPGTRLGLISVAAALVALGAGPAAAQDRPIPPDSVARLDLPAVVADAVVDFFNDPRRTRFEGDAEIAAGDTLRGDVAVLEGVLTIGGRVEGSIVVVNGSVRMRPGATVTGDLLVVGGGVEGWRGRRCGGRSSAIRNGCITVRTAGASVEWSRPAARWCSGRRVGGATSW
jgi:hypothetical protein